MLGIDNPHGKRASSWAWSKCGSFFRPAKGPIPRQRACRDLRLGGAFASTAYSRQCRAAKGLLRQYLAKMTGRSRAQIARLIQQYQQGRELEPARCRRHRFARQYTPTDIDEAHETLSGPATRQILRREYQQYKQGAYERLAGISVAHIYRLRRCRGYRQRRLHAGAVSL